MEVTGVDLGRQLLCDEQAAPSLLPISPSGEPAPRPGPVSLFSLPNLYPRSCLGFFPHQPITTLNSIGDTALWIPRPAPCKWLGPTFRTDRTSERAVGICLSILPAFGLCPLHLASNHTSAEQLPPQTPPPHVFQHPKDTGRLWLV